MSFNNPDEFRLQQQERTAAPRSEPRRPGMQLVSGRFELVKLLGGGGMGEVWEAVDRHAAEHGNEQADGEVALKFLPLAMAGVPAMLQQFQKSFASIRKVQGRYLCPLYDMQADERVGHFIVMKRVRGHDLARVIKKQGPLPLDKAVPIIGWAAAGLDELHEQHFIHRDVKPENIMLAPNDAIPLQIIDYGVSGEIRDSVARCSGNTGFEGGTYAYMSPERLHGKTGGPPADQYALGCVAYFLLTGNPPFVGNPGVVMRCHLEDPIEPIDGISPEVNGVLLRAMAKTPGERFASCGDFAKTLREAASMASQSSAAVPPPIPPARPSVVLPRRGAAPQNDTHSGIGADTAPKIPGIVIPRRGASRTAPPASGNTVPLATPAPGPVPGPIVIDSSTNWRAPPPLSLEGPASRIARSENLTSAFVLGLAAAACYVIALLVCTACWNATSGVGGALALISMFVCLVAPLALAVSAGAFYGIAWSSLPTADPRLPTATAVALLAVPGFNIYWFYRIQYLLWQRLNAATQASGRGQQPIPVELIWLQLVPLMGLVVYFVFQAKVRAAFQELRSAVAPGGA